MPSYFVLTYDYDREEYTPQVGLRKGPYSLWGLKRALQWLRGKGYQVHRRDHDVMVYREPNEWSREDGRRARIKHKAQRIAMERKWARDKEPDLFAGTTA